eukprot:6418147-Amphidinium_carterae.1
MASPRGHQERDEHSVFPCLCAGAQVRRQGAKVPPCSLQFTAMHTCTPFSERPLLMSFGFFSYEAQAFFLQVVVDNFPMKRTPSWLQNLSKFAESGRAQHWHSLTSAPVAK